MDWMVTVPKKTDWDGWLAILEKAERDGGSLPWHCKSRPQCEKGDRCFIVFDGKVRGWLRVKMRKYIGGPWRSEVTDSQQKPGWYLALSAPFNAEEGPEYKGFPGIVRYFPAGYSFEDSMENCSGKTVIILTGKTYELRHDIRARGFSWDADRKVWTKAVDADAIAGYRESCQNEWKGVEVKVAGVIA